MGIGLTECPRASRTSGRSRHFSWRANASWVSLPLTPDPLTPNSSGTYPVMLLGCQGLGEAEEVADVDGAQDREQVHPLGEQAGGRVEEHGGRVHWCHLRLELRPPEGRHLDEVLGVLVGTVWVGCCLVRG